MGTVTPALTKTTPTMALLRTSVCRTLPRGLKKLQTGQTREICSALSFSQYQYQRRLQLAKLRFYAEELQKRGQPLHTTSASFSLEFTRTKPDVSYDELVDLINKKEATIIDVREPRELEKSGVIPSSTNIPLRLIPDALNMPDEKFENLFGIEKPDEDAELIFTCYIGKRSFVAREIAKSLGFSRARHYPGG